MKQPPTFQGEDYLIVAVLAVVILGFLFTRGL